MKLDDLKSELPEKLYTAVINSINELRPAQIKAIDAGLLKCASLLVCTPTASGKTFIAELACMKNILERKGKAIYIVPLKALASEKYEEFNRKYGMMCNIALSIGEIDKVNPNLEKYDLIITTSEKLDSLIRHQASWIRTIATIIIDEIHLINDAGRGPTLEILITILKQIIKAQIIGLSATIGNPKELAGWLNAKLVEDDWRPVKLKKGILLENKIEFY